jgi:hypothetical protein
MAALRVAHLTYGYQAASDLTLPKLEVDLEHAAGADVDPSGGIDDGQGPYIDKVRCASFT